MAIDNDFILVFGLLIAVLTIPAILSALIDKSAARIAAFAAVVGGAMIIYALYNEPGGYAVSDLPGVFTKVVAQIVR